jgi:hypothetical protein
MPVTIEDLPSRPYRGLEALVLGGLILAAVTVAGFPLAMTSAALGGVGSLLAGGMLLGLLLLGVLLAIVVPVLLFLDARKLAGYDGDLEWTPSPGLYGVLGFFFSGLAALDYLYKRQNVVIDREARSNWWAVAIVGAVLPTVMWAAGLAFGLFALGFLGTAIAVLLPIGVYKDATYARLETADWQPNPTAHPTYGVLAAVLGPLALVYTGYYLYKRHSHVGTP